MLTSLSKQTTRKFLFDACAGLSGSETLHQFACIYDEATRRFYVWLGDTDFALFTKSTIIDIEGVHLLVVPSTSVKYDEKKERKLELEAKQKRLQVLLNSNRLVD